MKAPHSAQCVLRTLENPTLNGVLLGLDCSPTDIAPQEKMFPCCAGAGFRDDPRADGLRRCGLAARMNATRALLGQYVSVWGETAPTLPHQMPPQKSARLIMEVADTLKGRRPQASTRSGTKDKPGDIYALALTAVWRFGMPAYVVSFQESRGKELYASDMTSATRPPLLFIEQVDGLWAPEVANAFEGLIAMAYGANAYVWVEFVGGEKEDKPGARAGGSVAAFSRKIAAMKTKSPWEYLETSARSRLEAMCRVPRMAEEDVFHG